MSERKVGFYFSASAGPIPAPGQVEIRMDMVEGFNARMGIVFPGQHPQMQHPESGAYFDADDLDEFARLMTGLAQSLRLAAGQVEPAEEQEE